MTSYQSAKEEIRRSADIVELIGQFVQLKKAGRNFVGLCPFHAEKDPSFTVNRERQTFHCFGCKKGGDIFSFWMEYHSSTFPEALRDLAERYNVTISEGFSASAEREKALLRDALFKINEKAMTYFQKALTDPVKGEPGRTYLNQRSVADEIISEFRIGYAPDEWDGLTRVLRRHHMDPGLAVQAGLIIQNKSGGYYDRFRGRAIFPIFDLRQQVVGFGGRVLDDSLPKYLNTPETPIFQKGEILYGLHSCHKAIREKNRAVIVEGYMDCLALRKHGLQEVVATLGTALTERHVRKLKGYTGEAVVVFDSDVAGKTAALRSLPVFSNEGLSSKAVVLPDGHDPDSFVNANGLDMFMELLDRAPSMFEFFLEQKITGNETDEGKINVLKEILPVLSDIRNFALRSLYAGRLAEKTGVREEVVLSELAAFMKNSSERKLAGGMRERMRASMAEKKVGDLQLLNLLVHHPHTATRLRECDSKILLSDPVVVEIVDTIFAKYVREGEFSAENLQESLESEAAREQLREILHRPFIVYSEQDVEQAVVEFEAKARQKKFLTSLKKAKGNAKTQNHLIKSQAQGPTVP